MVHEILDARLHKGSVYVCLLSDICHVRHSIDVRENLLRSEIPMLTRNLFKDGGRNVRHKVIKHFGRIIRYVNQLQEDRHVVLGVCGESFAVQVV